MAGAGVHIAGIRKGPPRQSNDQIVPPRVAGSGAYDLTRGRLPTRRVPLAVSRYEILHVVVFRVSLKLINQPRGKAEESRRAVRLPPAQVRSMAEAQQNLDLS